MQKKVRAERLAGLSLLLVAVVWGTGFIATEIALQAQLNVTFIMALRFMVAAFILLPFQLKKLKGLPRRTLIVGVSAGALLCPAFFTQTYGQALSSVSHSAFLTTTNVVMVPFIAWLFTKRRPQGKTYLLALLTLLGIGLITWRPQAQDTATLLGDGLILIGAALFAMQIAFVGVFARGEDAQMITFLQLGTAGILSSLAMLILKVPMPQVGERGMGIGLWAVLYLALFSTLICFFIQTKAQQHTAPAKAAIFLSAEGLFGSLFSVMLGYEPFTLNLLLGGIIILSCVVLTDADIPFIKRRKEKPVI